MDVMITRLVKADGDGTLKGFCDVAVGDLLLIRGVRILQGRNGPFVSMPRQQSRRGTWYESVIPLTKELRDQLAQAVLHAFHERSS